METKAVIFDLYGTLLHCIDERKPFKRLFRELGLSEAEMLEARMVTRINNFSNFEALVQRLRPGMVIDCSGYQADLEKELAAVVLYPEVAWVLDELKRRELKLGLISNLATPYKRPVSDLNLDSYFDAIIYSCDAGVVKPDPLIYELMIQSLGFEPQQLLMTGDLYPKDVLAPINAGMRAVHLDRLHPVCGSILTLDGIFDYL